MTVVTDVTFIITVRVITDVTVTIMVLTIIPLVTFITVAISMQIINVKK